VGEGVAVANGSQFEQPRLTPKQELFVAGYIETSNASEAYRRAYNVKPTTKDETIRVNAAKLLADTNVALRIRTLQERASTTVMLTRAWVLERLMRNADRGHDKDDLAASNKALELLGKTEEMQMFIERSNVTSDNRHNHTAEPLSPFAEFIGAAIAAGTKDLPEDPLPN
jgi:hypothetical protein